MRSEEIQSGFNPKTLFNFSKKDMECVMIYSYELND